MIVARGLRKTLPDADAPHEVLRGVDLTVAEGESVAILGRSGSGKSTLLSLLALFDGPDTGEYTLAGRPTVGLREAERCRLRHEALGFVFQRFFLLKHLTAVDNVETALLTGHTHLSRRDRRARAHAALDAVGIAHLAQRRPPHLSGGEQQRVAIARALVTDPRVLLADEPTGALDAAVGGQVLDLLADLTSTGTAVVMVTHDREYARRLDRTVLLEDGVLTCL